ncbi:putative transcription factor C2H2 family [Helianthus annuus]|uniref:Putative zinc finger, RING/FYVE/PHD-type n=1 Tax=Helianthus annuus TaxID=4232 RepID=A0A251TKQ3_HELAN|nr:E3 ubiquitin-protein ligase SIS3 isoform X1 [Helianthus annuus]KAF5807125.1 putative transcription factor C2H2 family [Helianthus annuus]KAJ0585650.1 putative transcription factor C2H2 family [Helianthus annuus]KAJ0920240.1 putative transcription factor C2H2 family [Helianthus annuus]KAJ0923888.1 putative transcription factor C2H2 family [Helianthus annuus]
MALRVAGFRWYDGFFLSMLAFSIIMVVLSWHRYHGCKLPLHLWLAVDYGAVFVFRILMFVDNWIASAVRLDYGRQLRGSRLIGRLVVISILYGVLYPFLWGWSFIGAIWFAAARKCLPEKNQKWGFLVWLLFSFCGLICLAGSFGKKWLIRRQAHVRRAPQGTRVSEHMVLLNMIRQPDWVYEVHAHEARAFEQETNPYNTGMNLNAVQRAAVETAIQQLPVYILKGIPPDCSDCPICLEEFVVGQGVRGLPCAHNFHVACIDKWLILNTKCPRCRCIVFPFLNLNNPSTISVDPDGPSVSTTQHMRSQPSSSIYLTRMQSFLVPAQEEESVPSDSSPNQSPIQTSSNSSDDAAVEIVEDKGEPSGPIQ